MKKVAVSLISVRSMSLDKLPLVTEEPYPGWLRFEIEGQKPWYKTPVPRIVLRNTNHLREYLRKEQAKEKLLDVNENGFSFKRRLGLRAKSAPTLSSGKASSANGAGSTIEDSLKGSKQFSSIERLIRSNEPVNHRKLLCQAATSVDTFRLKETQVKINLKLTLWMRESERVHT